MGGVHGGGSRGLGAAFAARPSHLVARRLTIRTRERAPQYDPVVSGPYYKNLGVARTHVPIESPTVSHSMDLALKRSHTE